MTQRKIGFRRRIMIGLSSLALLAAGSAALVGSGSAATGPPAAGGYFQVLPAGSALPSEASCAAQVHHSSWEPRADNTTANFATPNPNTLANFEQWSSAWNTNSRPRINGNFHGTTDEIIQFYACKWGWSDELIRAEAVSESSWHQSTVGDGGTSFGLMQVRYLYHPRVPAKSSPGSSWPNTERSTSWNVDQFGAEIRGCYDGQSTYLGNTRGDVWGCIQSWYSGAWSPNGGNQWYSNEVRSNFANKPWLGWADQSGGTSPTTRPVSTTIATTTTTKPATTTTQPVTTTTITPPPPTTTTKPPTTTTTVPQEPNNVVYMCLNSNSTPRWKVESGRMGITPQTCYNSTDRVITVGYANLP